MVLLPIAGIGGRQGFKYVKTNPNFCATSCHLMREPAEKWKHSAHKDVACQTCHRADIFEEMRLGYAGYIERPDHVPKHTKLDSSICAECHMSNDARWNQVGQTPGHKAHVGEKKLGCLECHVTRVHEFAVDTQSCTRCHGADQLRLTKMDDLHCIGCHDFLGRNGHKLRPVAENCRECHPAEPPPKGAVTQVSASSGGAGANGGADGHGDGKNGKSREKLGKAAPVWKGHENCLGCHRPHGKPLDDPLDCLGCHRKMLAAESTHYKDERLTACRECHEPHEKD